MEQCYLRKATLEDMNFLFELANDSEVRKNSFHSEEIQLDEHEKWFLEKLQSDNCEIYILMVGDIPVGQIRLDYTKASVVISYSLVANYRGQGYGREILSLAEKEIRSRHSDIHTIEAEVKTDNIASRRKFEQLGYQSVELVKYKKEL